MAEKAKEEALAQERALELAKAQAQQVVPKPVEEPPMDEDAKRLLELKQKLEAMQRESAMVVDVEEESVSQPASIPIP